MKNLAIYLLLCSLTLSACRQNDRQHNLANCDTVFLDSTRIESPANCKETLLIDSTKVTIFAAVLGANAINISVYKDREGVIEQESSPCLKEKLFPYLNPCPELFLSPVSPRCRSSGWCIRGNAVHVLFQLGTPDIFHGFPS